MSDYWLGFAICFCWERMTQQWIGKDDYLNAAKLLWTNEPWWSWLLIMVLCLGLNLLRKYLKPE